MKERALNREYPGAIVLRIACVSGLHPSETRSTRIPAGSIGGSCAWICDSRLEATSTLSAAIPVDAKAMNNIAMAAAPAIFVLTALTLYEPVGDTLHLIRHLNRLGARLIGALRRDQTDQLLNRAFIRHFEEALRDRAETVRSCDAALGRARGFRSFVEILSHRVQTGP